MSFLRCTGVIMIAGKVLDMAFIFTDHKNTLDIAL